MIDWAQVAAVAGGAIGAAAATWSAARVKRSATDVGAASTVLAEQLGSRFDRFRDEIIERIARLEARTERHEEFLPEEARTRPGPRPRFDSRSDS